MLILAQMLVLGEKLLWHGFAFLGMASPLHCLPIATCYKVCWVTVCRNLHCSIKTEDGWGQKVCKEASATFFSLYWPSGKLSCSQQSHYLIFLCGLYRSVFDSYSFGQAEQMCIGPVAVWCSWCAGSCLGPG